MAAVMKPYPPTPPSAPDPAAIIRAKAFQLIGTDAGCDFWLSDPNPELGGKSPNDLVRDGHAEMVVRYLDANLAGEFG